MLYFFSPVIAWLRIYCLWHFNSYVLLCWEDSGLCIQDIFGILLIDKSVLIFFPILQFHYCLPFLTLSSIACNLNNYLNLVFQIFWFNIILSNDSIKIWHEFKENFIVGIFLVSSSVNSKISNYIIVIFVSFSFVSDSKPLFDSLIAFQTHIENERKSYFLILWSLFSIFSFSCNFIFTSVQLV